MVKSLATKKVGTGLEVFINGNFISTVPHKKALNKLLRDFRAHHLQFTKELEHTFYRSKLEPTTRMKILEVLPSGKVICREYSIDMKITFAVLDSVERIAENYEGIAYLY